MEGMGFPENRHAVLQAMCPILKKVPDDGVREGEERNLTDLGRLQFAKKKPGHARHVYARQSAYRAGHQRHDAGDDNGDREIVQPVN